MFRSFVIPGVLIALIAACGGRALEGDPGLLGQGSPPEGTNPQPMAPLVSPPRAAPAGMPPPPASGGSPSTVPPPVVSPPVVSRPAEPLPLDPFPEAPECNRGVLIVAFDQVMIDDLEGCEVLPDGLHMVGGLDLRPLHALREVGGEGLSIADGIDLRGLENLQTASKLIVSNFRISNFRELRSLRDVQWLEVHDSDVTDFQGLEGVSGITGLALYGNGGLVSLSGLSLSPEMSAVILENNAQLRSIEELRAVTSIRGDLWILGTGVESLAALENVGGSIGVVDISGNQFLRDISALSRLWSLGNFYLRDNPALESAPDFASLSQLDAAIISNNAALQTPPAFPLLGVLPTVEVTFNPQLSRLDLSRLEFALMILVTDNENLAEVTFGNLREAERLFIFNNPSLDGASVAASVADVQGEVIRIPSDQTVTRFSPCPWTLDSFCDSDLLCAPGTDPVCNP